MDESLRHHNPNPVLTANPLSKLFFWWLNPLFKTGYVRQLEVEDMYNVVKADQSEYLGEMLEREWQKEVEHTRDKKRGPSLFRAMFRMFGAEYMLLGIILFCEEATKVIQPLLLGGLIRYFTPNSDVSRTESFLYAMGVSLCAIVLAISHHPYFFTVQRIGMKMRIACCSLIYRKSLRLSNASLGKTTTGQIVNLMSNDVNRFDQAVIFLHFLWVGPLEAIAILAILWKELGPSALAGFGVLLLLVPVQGWMGKLFSKFRQKTARHTDERIRVMNEIIAGMRVIKMYCWEKPFGELVGKIRNAEAKNVRQNGYIRGMILGPFFVSAKLILLVVFTAFASLGGRMRSDLVFTTITLYNAVRLSTVLFLPFAVQSIAECKVTFERMEKFLLLEELDSISNTGETTQTGENTHVPLSECHISINNISAKWDMEIEQSTLHDVSAEVKPGKLLAVIGPVGAGKSSLLMTVLRELPLSSGSIAVKGTVAYVSQQPWVFSASLRQNITFGNKYEKARYEKIMKACALNKDIALMPHGDMTLIGDRGVSLSGGQRARVSLARALYMNASVYLLDDPLSAVDAAVGRHIFNNVVQGILRHKPRILVTHQVQFLKEAEQILILKDGEMIGKGTYEHLASSGIDFSSLLKREDDGAEEEAIPSFPDQHGSSLDLSSKSHDQVAHSGLYHHGLLRQRSRLDSSCSRHAVNESGSMMSLNSIGLEFEAEAVQLPEEEERGQGTVGFGVYYKFFKAGAGLFKFILLAFICLAAQGSYILSDWWLAYWSNQEEARYAATERQAAMIATGLNASDTNITIPSVDTHHNLSVFAGIIGGVFVLGLIRALMFFKVMVDASQILHNTMFASILRSQIAFFDTNPVGRILNRFSKDVGHMDDMLPITFFDFVQCSLLIIGIVIVAGVVNPWVFIPVVPLIILFIIIRRYYLRTSRHVKRLEGTTRSPVFSHLSATLLGLQTIRAFGVQDKFVEEFDAHQNLHTESWFLFLTTSRWLATRLDWLCAMFVTAVSFCCVFAADSLNAGLVGLSMTYAMTLMGMFQWGVRQSAEVENQMISVERVLEYSQLPSEAPLEVEQRKQPPPDWPSQGVIQAEGACLRYSAEAPLVLKNLSFKIHAKEKVGIVGRTGAGKSSLITMLFRLVEPSGTLTIDGIDIQSIGLHDLRKKISIIPQDPVLFTGALRKNLDPFNTYSDDVLWRALEEVQLKPAVEDLPHGLDSEVSEGGINFSVGQRQLICLARAILRNNKILMIDEATANVDPRTDALIQETIREKFDACTVLTIAHRLNTIMDSDRILMLNEGQIIEFDSPYVLMQKDDGFFRKLVEQTGKAETASLLQIARNAHNKRNRETDPDIISSMQIDQAIEDANVNAKISDQGHGSPSSKGRREIIEPADEGEGYPASHDISMKIEESDDEEEVENEVEDEKKALTGGLKDSPDKKHDFGHFVSVDMCKTDLPDTADSDVTSATAHKSAVLDMVNDDDTAGTTLVEDGSRASVTDDDTAMVDDSAKLIPGTDERNLIETQSDIPQQIPTDMTENDDESSQLLKPKVP